MFMDWVYNQQSKHQIVCRYYRANCCVFGDQCRYYHPDVLTDPLDCPFGDKCRMKKLRDGHCNCAWIVRARHLQQQKDYLSRANITTGGSDVVSNSNYTLSLTNQKKKNHVTLLIYQTISQHIC